MRRYSAADQHREASSHFQRVKHQGSALSKIVDFRKVGFVMRSGVMRSYGPIVAVALIGHEASRVSLVPPQVVLQVSRLSTARNHHAAKQCFRFFGLAWPGDKDAYDLHYS